MKKDSILSVCLVSLLFVGICGSSAHAQPKAKRDNKEDAQKAPTLETLQRAIDALRSSHDEEKKLQTKENDALRKKVKELEAAAQEGQLELIKIKAEAEAQSGGQVTKQADAEADTRARTFRGGQRALQALNPEISIVGDAFGKLIINDDFRASEADRSGFFFRVAGLHFEAALDPMSTMKTCVAITPSGVVLGEAYMTWTGILPGVSLTIGNFRQQFGVVNRWHVPGLDQFFFPPALTTVLGPMGLVQTGFSVDWLMPAIWADATHLMVQITNAQNGHLFAGSFFSIPSALLRFTNYWDLSASTYFELGLTGMVGPNNARGKPGDAPDSPLVDEDWRATWVWGADWTLSWIPPGKEKYFGLVLRGEAFGVHKELADGERIDTWGLYQYAHAKLSRRVEVGARFDFSKSFAVDNDDAYQWGVTPYINWWQSPWVRLRLLYALTRDTVLEETDHRVIVQTTFSVGPHKHARY